jgi:hypothetical protein
MELLDRVRDWRHGGNRTGSFPRKGALSPRFERSFLNTNIKIEHYLTMESVGLKKVFCHTHFDTITKLQMNPPLKVNVSPIHSSLMISSKGASQGNSDSSKTVTIAIIHHRE